MKKIIFCLVFLCIFWGCSKHPAMEKELASGSFCERIRYIIDAAAARTSMRLLKGVQTGDYQWKSKVKLQGASDCFIVEDEDIYKVVLICTFDDMTSVNDTSQLIHQYHNLVDKIDYCLIEEEWPSCFSETNFYGECRDYRKMSFSRSYEEEWYEPNKRGFEVDVRVALGRDTEIYACKFTTDTLFIEFEPEP